MMGGSALAVLAVALTLPASLSGQCSEPAEREHSPSLGRRTALGPESLPSPEQVTVQEVRLSGLNHLSPQEQEAIVAEFQGRTFPSTDPEGATNVWPPEWLGSLRMRVQDSLGQQGYFLAEVSPKITELRREGNRREVAVQVQVQEGEQYRLNGIRFTNNKAFPAEQLRKEFRLADGAILNVIKIRQGLEALRGLYGTKGYVNLTAIPDSDIDEAERTILITVDIDEGKVFRVGKVDVLGLNAETTGKLLDFLKPGQVYDSSAWDRFSRQFPGILPEDAPFGQATGIRQNAANCTVDIVVDLRQR